MSVEYTDSEMMIIAASRIIENKKSVFVGTGLPLIAAMLAQKTHAPDMLMFFEAGGVGPLLNRLPMGVGDSRTFRRAIYVGSMLDVMEDTQLGYLDYGFIGAAQIDKYGNVNTTCIGPHEKPKVCLPGSGGANDISSLCWKTIILMRHEKRRFVNNLDFLTSPGYIRGFDSREKAGLPKNTGPYRVVTNLAILGFNEETKAMTLLSLNPGITLEQVKSETGFDLLIPQTINVTKPPSQMELKVLREEIYPVLPKRLLVEFK